MEIIIGREHPDRRLCFVVNGKPLVWGEKGSVPQDVSRQHCTLTTLDDGRYQLKNINIANVTYVNGREVAAKTVTEADVVELGASRYRLSWEAVKKAIPVEIDLRPLRQVWKDYETGKIEMQVAERKLNAARSAVGVVTMLAMICSLLGGRGPVYYLLYGIGFAASLYFAVKAYKNASDVPQRTAEMTKEFQKNYVCPHCHKYMGMQDYDLLSQNDGCPYCKNKYKFK